MDFYASARISEIDQNFTMDSGLRQDPEHAAYSCNEKLLNFKFPFGLNGNDQCSPPQYISNSPDNTLHSAVSPISTGNVQPRKRSAFFPKPTDDVPELPSCQSQNGNSNAEFNPNSASNFCSSTTPSSADSGYKSSPSNSQSINTNGTDAYSSSLSSTPVNGAQVSSSIWDNSKLRQTPNWMPRSNPSANPMDMLPSIATNYMGPSSAPYSAPVGPAIGTPQESGSVNGKLNGPEETISTAIVIKNIPFCLKKESMLSIFASLDAPRPYALNYHFDHGVFRGLAFANFYTVEDTRRVLSLLNGVEVQGRKLRVELKRLLPLSERERAEREKRERKLLEEQKKMKKIDLDMNDPYTLEIYSQMLLFRDDVSGNPPSMKKFVERVGSSDRKIITVIASKFGLNYHFESEGDERYIVVTRSKLINGDAKTFEKFELNGGMRNSSQVSNETNRGAVYRKNNLPNLNINDTVFNPATAPLAPLTLDFLSHYRSTHEQNILTSRLSAPLSSCAAEQENYFSRPHTEMDSALLAHYPLTGGGSFPWNIPTLSQNQNHLTMQSTKSSYPMSASPSGNGIFSREIWTTGNNDIPIPDKFSTSMKTQAASQAKLQSTQVDTNSATSDVNYSIDQDQQQTPLSAVTPNNFSFQNPISELSVKDLAKSSADGDLLDDDHVLEMMTSQLHLP